MSVIHFREPFNLDQPETLRLDFNNPKPKELVSIIELFEAEMKVQPVLGPLPVATGWIDIDPRLAVTLLRRNRPGANRKVDPGTSFFYGRQMAGGDWKATGQGLLFDRNGHLIDGQHRLYAILLSSTTVRMFVLTEIEAIPNLFAYVDSSRPRTAATALQTAGFNGASTVIAKIVKFAEEVDAGVYNRNGATNLPRMSPAEMLGLINKYPNAKTAARAASSDWAGAVDYLGVARKDIVAYMGMKIMDLYNYEVADDFFTEVMLNEDRAADDPFAALRKEIDKDNKLPKQMKRQVLFGILVKVFNAWQKKESLGRRWVQMVTEDLPEVDSPPPQAVEPQAAE